MLARIRQTLKPQLVINYRQDVFHERPALFKAVQDPVDKMASSTCNMFCDDKLMHIRFQSYV